MNVYCLSFIFSIDTNTKKGYMLSHKSQPLLFPLKQIECPKHYTKELLQFTANLFDANEISFNEECSYNFKDVQDMYSIEYINKYYPQIDLDNSLIITYAGLLLHMKESSSYQWNELIVSKKHKGFTPDKNINLVIDNVMSKIRV